MERIVELLEREEFETKLCEAINEECGTNFAIKECEKIKGIFIVEEVYGGRFQRFTNFGKPCKFSPKSLKDTITVCIQAVKARKERQENA